MINLNIFEDKRNQIDREIDANTEQEHNM